MVASPAIAARVPATTAAAAVPAAWPAVRSARDERRRPVLFEYLGQTALSARGPRTGRLYRFVSEGAVVGIDPRDAAALDQVPQLRRLVDRG